MSKDKEIVEMVENSLRLIKKFPRLSSRPKLNASEIFHVEKDGLQYILKFSPYAERWIERERKALTRLKEIEGNFPELIDYYSEEGYTAILKTYIQWDLLSQVRKEEIGKGFKEDLEAHVTKCHMAGIISLDLRSHNILISPCRKKAALFDFDDVRFKEDYSSLSDYEDDVKTDLRYLRACIQREGITSKSTL